MPTRSERRRALRQALARSELPAGQQPFVRSRDAIIAAAVIGSVIGVVALGIVVFTVGGENGGGRRPFVARTVDEKAIEDLSRRSIEVLPQGQWASLYGSFTDEFKQRCSEQQFADVGTAETERLSSSLSLLSFRRLEDVSIEGDTARAVIVGQIEGQPEYRVEARFQKISEVWKLSPGPNAQGCDAFERLES